MAEKYVKIGGVWKPALSEHLKIGGVFKNALTNYPKIGGDYKPVGFEKLLWVCESANDRLYGLNDTPSDLSGWPLYGSSISDPSDVACDQSGNSYWGCGSGVHKYDKAGVEQWIYNTGLLDVISVCAGVDGSVYAGDSAGTVVKLSSSGSLQWAHSFGSAVYSLALDYPGGSLYVGLGFTKKEVHRADAGTGSSYRLLTVTTYGDVTGLAVVSGTPDLLIGTSGGYLMRWNNSSGYLWGNGGVLGTGQQIETVRAGHDGFIYCTTSLDGTVCKKSFSDGSVQWVYGSGGVATGLGVDVFGNVYASWRDPGHSSTANCLRKINKSGVLQWTWRPYLSAQMFGVAVNPGIMAAGM